MSRLLVLLRSVEKTHGEGFTRDLCMVDDVEKMLREKFNRTTSRFHADSCIPQLVVSQSGSSPNRIAVEVEPPDELVTRGELRFRLLSLT